MNKAGKKTLRPGIVKSTIRIILRIVAGYGSPNSSNWVKIATTVAISPSRSRTVATCEGLEGPAKLKAGGGPCCATTRVNDMFRGCGRYRFFETQQAMYGPTSTDHCRKKTSIVKPLSRPPFGETHSNRFVITRDG